MQISGGLRARMSALWVNRYRARPRQNPEMDAVAPIADIRRITAFAIEQRGANCCGAFGHSAAGGAGAAAAGENGVSYSIGNFNASSMVRVWNARPFPYVSIELD